MVGVGFVHAPLKALQVLAQGVWQKIPFEKTAGLRLAVALLGDIIVSGHIPQFPKTCSLPGLVRLLVLPFCVAVPTSSLKGDVAEAEPVC